MAGLKEERRYARHLFILFYTLRQLWKSSGHNVDELYTIVFPSKNKRGGNKTLYDNILRLQEWDISKHSRRLAELIGLNDNYFSGEHCISIPTLTEEDWLRFIRLREKQGGTTVDELRQLEKRIKEGIKEAKDNPIQEPLKKLVYFATFKHKKADKTLEDLFGEIEGKISECKPRDFETASLALLERHQQKIHDHLNHIAAVVTVRKWKEAESGNL